MQLRRFTTALFGGALISMGCAIAANLPAVDVNAGAKLVSHNGCMGCHGAKFQGGLGPKLFGIERRLSNAQIADFIKHPRAPMPDFGFSDAQVNDIAGYLANLDGGASGVPVISLQPATPKDRATVTVRFTAVIPKQATVRASMQMGAMSHHSNSQLHPTKDRHIWRGVIEFSMGGAWVLTLVYDGKHVDMPLNVAGGM